MGVNMPARTVVFTSMRKWDGETFRPPYARTPGRPPPRPCCACMAPVIPSPTPPWLRLLYGAGRPPPLAPAPAPRAAKVVSHCHNLSC